MGRSILVLYTSGKDNALNSLAIECWFYEMEIAVTSSMWVQLIVNKNVRDHLLKSWYASKQMKQQPLTL
ncbi:hypothetical protein Y032_0308g2044 [Ancylostoma ceylanicum]|uniref:Uncharacterized protein n=1 Tax=Ancylostoma ceylanicum TaxID=53326 RepID=A0A016S2X3_9BILA|nr:hypothetical protein Y032_0308g2044 [Ancylostoma ceylanicum]